MRRLDRLEMRSRHVAREIVVPVIDRAGAFSLTRRLSDGRRVTLNYHNVEPDVFRVHAAFLRATADVVDIERLSDANAWETGLKVGLTFDDGYRHFAEEIVPILTEFDLPATWFVPTANVGSERLHWFDRVRAALLHTSCKRVSVAGYARALREWNREYVAEALTRRINRLDDDRRQSAVAAVVAQLGEAPEHVLQRFRIVTPTALSELPTRVTVDRKSVV